MMRKFLVVLMFSVVIAVCADNNGSQVTGWIEKEYDFGLIKENAGKVKGEFHFVNNKEYRVRIEDVIATCGCTDVEYPLDFINVGDTAVVNFTFNPAGRPGKFDKTIKVYLSDENNPNRLILRGTVAASPETLSERYPIKKGDIYLSNDKIFGGDLKRGGRRHLYMNLYNNGNDSISFQWIPKTQGVFLKADPEELPPKESGLITFTVDTKDFETTGLQDFIAWGIITPQRTDTLELHVGINILSGGW